MGPESPVLAAAPGRWRDGRLSSQESRCLTLSFWVHVAQTEVLPKWATIRSESAKP